MEHKPSRRLREPGTEHATGLLTREQEQHAAARITRRLEAAATTGTGIDAGTARIIAAALHTGYGSHLEHFAATGALNPSAALAELHGGQLELHHVPWLTALWDFLERISTHHPDQPQPGHREPAPQVFVQPTDPHLGLQSTGGRWLDAAQSSDRLTTEMAAIAADTPAGTAEVTAWVGFHQLTPPAGSTATDIASYANGIRELGESYALYAAHHGAPVSVRTARARHYGSYASMTDFIDHEHLSTLDDMQAGRRGASTVTAEQALDQLEGSLRHRYLCLDGRDGVHVFRRLDGRKRRDR